MKLLDAAAAFQSEWIGAEINRCLNPRHRIEFCDVCSKACPQEAISLSVDDVEIAPAACNNCGLCAADCPTGVFTHDYFSPLKLISWARGKNSVVLHCQISGGEELGGDEARLPCHGVLDARVLAGLKTAGVMHVRLSGLDKCGACPTRVGGERLQKTLEIADIFLDDEFQVLEAGGAEGREAGDGVDDQGGAMYAEPELDRRGFLSGLGRDMVRAVSKAALFDLFDKEDDQVHAATVQDALMRKHVPDNHRAALISLFGGQVPAFPGGSAATGWFHDISANERCTGCQVCAIRCPTGALTWQDEAERVQLTYRTAACIGCGLCVSVCPYDVLKLSPQIHDRALIDDRVTTLFESEQRTCEGCGDHFLPHDGDNRFCWVCKNEKELDAEWQTMIQRPQDRG